jgi:ATP-dependent helicase/nuclease subunit A
MNGEQVRRLQSEQAASAAPKEPTAPAPVAPPLPAWAESAAPKEHAPARFAPSRLGTLTAAEAAEQPPLGPREQAREDRFTRGRLVHALLQHLPEVAPEAREDAAWALVRARARDVPAAMQDEIVGETLAILSDPRFAHLFGPKSLAEVPIVARFGGGEEARELTGQIDRLAVLDDCLLVLDYKTNRPPPATPADVAPAYIAQLAAYRFALAALFPGRPLRAALLWTDGPKLMEIPSTLLDAADPRVP